MLDWLLEEEDAPVRYWALRDLLDYPENTPQCKGAREKISEHPAVKLIFSQQQEDGCWRYSEDCYWPKFSATVWNLLILSDLRVSGSHPAVRKGCEYYLAFQDAQDRNACSSSFTGNELEAYRCVWEPCVTGNMTRAIINFGLSNDRRVRESIQWILEKQLPDGGWNCETGEWGKDVHHSSFLSTIEPLSALAAVNRFQRSDRMVSAIQQAAEFLLRHRLYKSDHSDFKVINEEWTKLRFPYFYFYDILRGLLVLTDLGYTDDERMSDAVSLVESKRNPDWTWNLEAVPTEKWNFNKDEKTGQWNKGEPVETNPAIALLGEIGKPNKWITLNALQVLKKLGRWNP